MRESQDLSVSVGEPWPEEIEIDEKDSPCEEEDTETRVSHQLALGAAVLIATFAVYAMVQSNQALLEKIYRLAEWTVVFVLGRIGVAYRKKRHA